MSAVSSTTSMYGLHVSSELPVRGHPDLVPVAPDVTIRVGGDVAANAGQPPGRLLLDLDLGRRVYAASLRDDGHYVLRCHGVCDFVIDAGLGHVTAHLVAGTEPGLASVLATGMLLSFILTMRGEAVLHASAVQVGAGALAFVGSSGMGKSTIAAMMCADGAALVTDDVLRVDLDPDRRVAPTCHTGTAELRIRGSAASLTSLFDAPVPVRRTADDRDALRLPGPERARLPLAGIVVPFRELDETRKTPTIERLDAATALLTLVRFPRLPGWRDPSTLRRQFHQLAEVAERVPVHVARLPAGPPFSAAVAAALRETVAPRASDSPVAG